MQLVMRADVLLATYWSESVTCRS